MTDEIGDPLEQAARTGVIGARKPVTRRDELQVKATTQRDEREEKTQPERVKRTLMFTPFRARWLKVQAALEGREMSDIVDEALATYEQLHPRMEK